jgi:putative SOS response-associated peptidase YedK
MRPKSARLHLIQDHESFAFLSARIGLPPHIIQKEKKRKGKKRKERNVYRVCIEMLESARSFVDAMGKKV